MEDQKSVICPKCRFQQKLTIEKNCQYCGASLRSSFFYVGIILLSLIGVGVLGTGTFLLRNYISNALPKQSLTNSVISPTQSRLGANSSSFSGGTGGGQLQNSIVTIYQQISDVSNVPDGVFNYGGSTSFAPLRSPKIIQSISQVFPHFQLRYLEPVKDPPGSGTGIKMLLHDQLSFAQSSRELNESELAQAQKRGYALEEIPIAIDGIAVYLNPKIIIRGLTISQIHDIFTGKYKNWKNFGGPDIEITPFRKAGANVDFFHENILEKEPFGNNVSVVRDNTESIRNVAAYPGGIGYATASEIINQQSIHAIGISRIGDERFILPCGDPACTTINTKAFIDGSYPITRRLLVIIKKDGKMDEKAGIAYANILLSSEGQTLINRAGFISLR